MGRKPSDQPKALLTAEATQTVGLAGIALACEALMLIGGIFVAIGLILALVCCAVVIILHWQEMWAAIRSRRFSRHSILPLAVVVVVPLLGALVANRDAILGQKALPPAIEPSPSGIVSATGMVFPLRDLGFVAHANSHPVSAARLGSVLVQCHDSLIPNIVLQPNGHAYVLILSNNGKNAIQTVDYTSPTGGPLPINKKDAPLADGYVCDVTNYSKRSMSPLLLGIVVQSWHTKGLGKGGFQKTDKGPLLASGLYVESMSANESDKFTFYIWNQGSSYGELTFAERGVAIDVLKAMPTQVNVVSGGPILSPPRWYYSRF